ncbi:PrgI family protein [Candidatus Daviesbacteria bacterium]|nr:PrgI family protein [Candidatus Daviesbacteria bacterium]
MDVHPIPQNVTSFQFKLVGDMTLKQFGYLAAGSAFAYFVFIVFARDYPFIAWPVIVFSALLGIGFAFLPIASRPLDYWLVAFLKAVYSPTYRVWKKNRKTFKEEPLFNSRLAMYLAGQPTVQPAPTPQPIAQPVQPVDISELPTHEELQKTVDLARQAQQLQMRIIQTERTLSQIKTETQKPTPIPVDYTQQVNVILADLQNLVTQASAIKQQIQSVTEEPPAKTEPVIPPVTKEKVKIIIPAKPKQTQIALTTFPNVINGIVKDKENNYLEGVVAVIYDKEGLPVRALKTNKLGQFTSSTPLPNGTYTLELEKDDFTFDVLQMELTGEILPPLMITAK